jgi:hypothetical protein
MAGHRLLLETSDGLLQEDTFALLFELDPDVTVALTGVLATADVGTVTPSVSTSPPMPSFFARQAVSGGEGLGFSERIGPW